ncbi:MAG: DNA recombination protein RmuC [bacterium]|nr:DNA recombination protein RmuC [bacterium]
MEIALIAVALMALAAIVVLVRAFRQRDEATRERDEANLQLGNLQVEHEARAREITKAREDLDTYFKGMAADVLRANSQAFLEQAKEQFASQSKLSESDLEKRQQAIDALVKPVRDNLKEFEKRVNEIEEKRQGAYEGLRTEVGLLRQVAGNLGEALRSSQMRGHWGEQQLRNVLELSGMSEHIDFFEQLTVTTGDSRGRPDAVVRVPGGAQVVIDAKTPLDSYLEAHNTSDDQQRQQELLQSHAGSLLGHARTLSGRNYDAAIDGSPDFVVMFVPADPILDSAMDVQPTLWQDAWEKHQVLIATPGLLLAFLKTVALAWREQARQENAQQIAQLGQDLYESLRTYAGHVDSMGKGLERAVKAYNDGIGSLEGRILPRARRFEDLDAVSGKEIEAPTRVEPVIRPVVAAELTEAEELPPDSPAA